MADPRKDRSLPWALAGSVFALLGSIASAGLLAGSGRDGRPGLLSVPVVIGVVSVVAQWLPGRRMARYLIGFAMTAWMFVTGASIGVFYFPAVIALLAAAPRTTKLAIEPVFPEPPRRRAYWEPVEPGSKRKA